MPIAAPRVTDYLRYRDLLDSLPQPLKTGRDILERGGTSLDAVEQVIRFLEDDPQFNAGKGAVFNSDGGHELDASIRDVRRQQDLRGNCGTFYPQRGGIRFFRADRVQKSISEGGGKSRDS